MQLRKGQIFKELPVSSMLLLGHTVAWKVAQHNLPWFSRLHACIWRIVLSLLESSPVFCLKTMHPKTAISGPKPRKRMRVGVRLMKAIKTFHITCREFWNSKTCYVGSQHSCTQLRHRQEYAMMTRTISVSRKRVLEESESCRNYWA